MVRVRIAPSPTGHLHIGNAQSALYNWLFAHKNKGQFFLRVEDTDKERSKKEYEDEIKKALLWLDLKWSNSEIYRQSERLDIYEQYLKELLDSGKAFWCDHTKEELETEQKEQMLKKEAPRHICKHKNNNLKSGQVIRLAVDDKSTKKIIFDDKIRGLIEWGEGLIGDLSLAKDLRTPLYNFAVVVDDIEMEISHVIRGEDHISNTPKQILIYEALGKDPPIFAHLPLILGTDKSKLSKRHGGVATLDYKKDYLPEAIINFLGSLCHTFSKEILTKEEMVQEFELEKVHKSGAIFDVKKLNWINSQYIKSLSADQLNGLTAKEIPDTAVPLITERLERLTDVQNFDYFWKEPEYERELLKWKKSDLNKSLETLAEVKKILESFDFGKEKDELRKVLDNLAKRIGGPVKSRDSKAVLRDHGASRGLVYWPLRVALTGKEKSPDPVDIAYVLGKQKTLERVRKASMVSD